MNASRSLRSVGFIGLGIMGSAMARHVIAAGFEAHGVDPDASRGEDFSAMGGALHPDAVGVWAASHVVISCLPSAQALHNVVAELCASARPGPVLAEASTLALPDKFSAHARMQAAGLSMMDCPLSGSGAQAQVRDVLVYASGTDEQYAQCLPAFQAFSRAPHLVGAFGQGSRLKYIANLLVAIHTAAAGEAFALARRCGLDPQQVADVVGDGAGGSRALAARAPMLVGNSYLPVRTMRMDLWAKDMQVIGRFARDAGAFTPLFDRSAALFADALQQGLGAEDTAAVARLFEGPTGVPA
jgi:L-threonate 2-dehydrogenase